MNNPADRESRAQELPITIEAEVFSARDRIRPDYVALTVTATLLSVVVFVHYWRSGELLLYGDAVAHMNIARRVLDTRLPGLFQFGTVWLPLPHLLMLPFVWSDWMWQTGVGGAIPSMIAYVGGVIGIFRLVWNGLSFLPANKGESRFAAWFAALIYALNPNLLYLQTTAMTEPLSLTLLIWSTLYLAEFRLELLNGNDPGARRTLYGCGTFLCLGMLTRYDSWFTAAVYGAAVLLMLLSAERRSGLERLHFLHEKSWRRAIATFLLLLVITPVTWLLFNKKEFKDPLAFVRGPYSARAIEARSRKPGEPHHPGWNAPSIAATYFVKSAKLNVATTERSERIWLYAALLGSVMLIGYLRPLWPWLLLWLPVPFYAISIAWGGVPIFMPVWWPFSFYNVRYGTQLLPAFVVFGSLLTFLFVRRFSWRSSKRVFASAAIAFVGWSYFTVWRTAPICLLEARVNSVGRLALESKLATQIAQLPPDTTLLMYIGHHGGALQRISFPLKRTINECHKRYWESALLVPALSADFIVATDGDPIYRAIEAHPQGLEKLIEITQPKEASISIYRSTLR